MTEGHPERGWQAESKDLVLGNKIMWLPKDERNLLRCYYDKLSRVDTRGSFFMSELEKCLKGKNKRNRIKTAGEMLKKRNLLDFLHDQGDALRAQLSLEGYDLGRKYASWWSRSGLWFAELKHHWFWVIVSFLLGIIAMLIVNWLSKVD